MTGGSNKRVSLAALIAIKPGQHPRLIYRVHRICGSVLARPWCGRGGFGEFWACRGSGMEIVHRPRPLKPGGPTHLLRLAGVSRHPAGCVEAHGRIADQRC